MTKASLRKVLFLLLAAGIIFLFVRYLLPILLPFLLGAGLCLLAEPLVRILGRKLHLPRTAASVAGVGVTVALAAGVLWLVGLLVWRELTKLSTAAPQIAQTARQGAQMLQDGLVQLAQHTPEDLRPMLTQKVLDLFSDGTALIDSAGRWALSHAGGMLGRVGDGLLTLGTILLSAFMLSVRLPKLRQWFARNLPKAWYRRYLPALRQALSAASGWFCAQGKLAAVTYGLVVIGFLFLQVKNGFLLAALVALVDAVPLLGTGTVLVPWAAVLFFQGQAGRGVGLLCLYGVTAVTRSVLEPRLVGKQLGLDALWTLVAFYLGYRLWGILGMILAPMTLAVILRLSQLGASGKN